MHFHAVLGCRLRKRRVDLGVAPCALQGRPVFFHLVEMPFDEYFGSSRYRGPGPDLHMEIAFNEVHAVLIAFDASAPAAPLPASSSSSSPAAPASPLVAVDACRDEVQRRIVGRMERRRARLLRRHGSARGCACVAVNNSGGAGAATMPLAPPRTSGAAAVAAGACCPQGHRAGFPLYLVAHKADALCAALAGSYDSGAQAAVAAPLGITVAINAAVAAAAVDTKAAAGGAAGRGRSSVAAAAVGSGASTRAPSLLPAACGLEPQDLAGYAHMCGYRSWHYTSVYHDGPPPAAAAATATATGATRASSSATAPAPGAPATSAAAIIGLGVAPLSLLGGIAGGAGTTPQPAGVAAAPPALPVADPSPSILSLWTTLVDDLLEYWGYVQEHADAVAAAPAVPLPASSPVAGDAPLASGASGPAASTNKPQPLQSRAVHALLAQLPPASSTGISLKPAACQDGRPTTAVVVEEEADPLF